MRAMSGRPSGSGFGACRGSTRGTRGKRGRGGDGALAVARALARRERVRIAVIAERPAQHAARAQADKRVAPDALALLGRLEQEGRLTGGQLAELEERRDR